MNSNQREARRGLASLGNRFLDVAMKVIPAAALIAIGALFTAQQVSRPNQRAIKAAFMVAMMAFMFRFDMVYSVYLFVLLFPFPSGISVASSNSVLMTVIPMIWAVRAASTRTTLFRSTVLDKPHGLFLVAYALSLMNVESNHALLESLRVIWRQVACIAFFAMIVTFVDEEKKLWRLLKTACVACGLVMSTAVIELIAPGAVIIPGWIGMTKRLAEGGVYTARLEKVRIGGALASDANLADFGSQLLGLMVFFAWRSRNPAAKAFWTGLSLLTLVAVLSTGNRGGLVGIVILFGYGLYLFRHRMSFAQMMTTVTMAMAVLLSANYLLSTYTYATSPIERLLHTEMVGMVPETRTMTWKPSIEKSMEHPFVGSGPYFEIGKGLSFQFWPHNAYLFYLQTIGLLGLGAFLWIMVRVGKMSMMFRARSGPRDDLCDLMALAHVWLLVFAVEQLGIDHQRDDVYPYLVWLLFAVIAVLAELIRRRNAAASGTT